MRAVRPTATALEPFGSFSTCFSISAIHSSHCFSISCRFSQKWAWVTWIKAKWITKFNPLLEIKGSLERWQDLFETRRRIAYLFEHGPLDGGLSNVDVVVTRVLVAGRSASRPFVARLVKVRLRDENERLNGDEDLQETGSVWIPFLFGSSVPSVEHRKANFAVVVQIWIETNCVPASGGQMHLHRWLRIIGWEIDVEFKTSVAVRRLVWPRYQNLFFISSWQSWVVLRVELIKFTFMISSRSVSQRTKTEELRESGREVVKVATSWANRFIRLGWQRSPAALTAFSKW